MYKTSLSIALVAFMFAPSEQRGTYSCTYISNGVRVAEDDRTEEDARAICSNLKNCSCRQTVTKCALGPDENGDIRTDVVTPPGMADSCDPNFCICTSHENYREILEERLAKYRPVTEEDPDLAAKWELVE